MYTTKQYPTRKILHFSIVYEKENGKILPKGEYV